MPRGRIAGDPIARFHEHYAVNEHTGCWVWQKFVEPRGYGRFKMAGAQMPAHRAAHVLFVGPIPDGMQIDHLCHTRDLSCPGGLTCPHRRCVNPAHLEIVTPHENVQRGLRCRKKAAPRRQPTERQRLIAAHYTAGEVAALLGVDRQTVSRRVRRGVLSAAMQLPGVTGGWLFDRDSIDALVLALRDAA